MVARHDKNIKSIDVSRNGLYCLTASGDHTAKEWRLEDGYCIKEYIGHTDMVNSVMYSPDPKNTAVLTGSYDGTVRIFDRTSGVEKFRFENHTWVRSAIYDKEGESILIASHSDCVVKELKRVSSETELWNWHTSYSGHKKAVTNVSLDSEGARVLSASEDGSVHEWDRMSSQCIKVYSGNMFSTTDTVYSKDGLLVLTIKGNTFSVARRNEGIALRYFQGCLNPITSVDFSPDSHLILSTSADGLWEWERESDRKMIYHLIYPKENYVAEHARYADHGTRIVCLSKSIYSSNQVGICVFQQGHPDPEYAYSLSVDAVGIKPLEEESAFLTISSNAVIRKWRIEDGQLLGVDGVAISGCNFSDCCFLDRTVKGIIAESQVVCKDLSLKQVMIGNQAYPLNGSSLIIYSKNNSTCFSLIDELDREFQTRQERAIVLSGAPELNAEEAFQEFWKNEKYVKRKVDPYNAFSMQIAWTDRQYQVLRRFFSLAKWDQKLSRGPLEERVLLWILFSLLRDEDGEISEEFYYCKGVALICQIDAGVCSPELQRGLVATLIEAFPNLQFIISSSATEIGTGEGAEAATRLGAKVLAIDEI